MRNFFRRATPYYALIQGLYWAIYCLMVSFASVFLLDRGFTNGQIGFVATERVDGKVILPEGIQLLQMK